MLVVAVDRQAMSLAVSNLLNALSFYFLRRGTVPFEKPEFVDLRFLLGLTRKVTPDARQNAASPFVRVENRHRRTVHVAIGLKGCPAQPLMALFPELLRSFSAH
jgi:hypothetical protein